MELSRLPSTSIARWSAWDSYASWRADAAQLDLAESPRVANLRDRLPGRCGLCGSQYGFLNTGGNLREGLLCLECGCNARQRAASMVLLNALEASKHRQARIYATEQASPLFIALRRRLPQLEGSEFGLHRLRRLRLGLWLTARGASPWIRNLDITRLDIPDGSLDGIVSLDVLEHVPQADRGLAEFARTLIPGGCLVLTVPFHVDWPDSSVIADVRADGSIVEHGQPEFHGDPGRGSVRCYHHFGWDLLERLRCAGFRQAFAIRVSDDDCGLPEGQWVLHALR